MHLSRSGLVRRGSFTILWILVAVLMAACAGSDASSDSSTSDSSSNPVSGAENNSTTPASQTSPVPTNGDGVSTEPLAARVNNQPITLADFERERARRVQGLTVEPATAAAFDATILESMIDQVLVEQAAVRENITVTDAEIDAELAVQEQLASAGGQSLEEIITSQLYTLDEYREAVRAMLLWGKVSAVVVAAVPDTTTQVHSRHILVKDEATARSLLDQLNQGADFAQLAIQYSLDSSTAPSGGDLDWVSRGDLLQPEVEEAVFSLEPGTRSPEPVKSSLGFHIIEVLERADGRPLDQAKLAERREQAFLDWLENERAVSQIERYVGTGSQ